LQFARTMRWTALLLLGFANSAAAAPAEQMLEQVAADDDELLVGYANVVAGGEGGAGTGGGALLTVHGPLGCNFVDAGVHGSLRRTVISGHADYSLCLARELFTIAFDGTRATGLAPGIDARRSLWARHYDYAYDRATFAVGEFDGHTVLEMVFGHGTTKQADDATTRKITSLDFEMTMYRYRNDVAQIDVIDFTSNALKAGDDNKGGVAGAIYPVRLRLEDDGIYVDAAAGWALAGGSVTQSSETKVNGEVTSSWTETIDGSGLPEMAVFGGDLEVGVKRKKFQASTRLARGFYPTFDGNLAREARLSAQLAYQRRRTSVAVAPFAARTHTWTREDGDSRDVSAGASLHVGRELSTMLRLDAIGEAGFSPYARLDGERLPASTLGGQVLVALTGSVKQNLRR
jgi:hypothetical protein